MFAISPMTISAEQIDRFQTDGFLVIERVIDAAAIDALRVRIPKLFAGEFDTGVYPDEWYWRAELSLPDVTRHMANAWKADRTIATLALSATLAQAAAALAQWPGVRLGQDTIWWKPPGTKAIALHQDSSFMDFLDPPRTVTCWVTLDDTRRDAGTLEYIPGSHRWPLTAIPDAFHNVQDYRSAMRMAAARANIVPPDPVYIEVPAGSVVFHAGEVWHGSGVNATADGVRRSIGLHLLADKVRFSDRHGGYIYRRYQLTGSDRLEESFFPILWCEDGYRTPWLDRYCETGRR